MKRIGSLLAVGMVGLLACTGCGRKDVSEITIDGSSTVYPITAAMAEEFQNAKSGTVHVTVGKSGTGSGFKRFVRKETDISDASRPIMKEELEEATKQGIEFIELPVCYDAITVVVNPQNDWLDSITIDDLKKMWEPGAQDRITHWNQIRPEWPNEKLYLFGAGSDSGTWDYFTEAVVGKAKSSRGDYQASEDDNILVQGIIGNKYALGFLPYSYYAANQGKLKALGIVSDKNPKPVLPSDETVMNGTYTPLSRPLFIYINKASADRPEVADFISFYLDNAPALARDVKMTALPPQAYELARKRFQERKTGSSYGGTPEVGLPIEEILKRGAES